MDALKKAKDGYEDLQETEQLTMEQMAELTIESVIHRTGPLDHRQNMIEYLNNCSICGSDLDFTHVTDFRHGEVKMEGYCSCCQVQLKNETHKLQ